MSHTLYIHKTTCISPQHTFLNIDIRELEESVNNKLQAIEPVYPGIPPGLLRRMSRAVRMGVGAALPLFEHHPILNGIIIGTGNGGMEDCIKFLNQIIEYDEGLLAPGSFVQSTPNAIASQVSMLKGNKGYNITHVHAGLSFENAILDALMQIEEFPSNNYIIGAVDAISSYNFNIDILGGWYKKELVSNKQLFETYSPSSLAGEGSAMFLVNGVRNSAIGQLDAISMLHTRDPEVVTNHLKDFIERNFNAKKIDLFLSGENGDNRLLKFYTGSEGVLSGEIPIARFKHMCGEYPTASAMALWIACYLLQNHDLPSHMVKRQQLRAEFSNILIYNNFKGAQHSFMLLSAVRE